MEKEQEEKTRARRRKRARIKMKTKQNEKGNVQEDMHKKQEKKQKKEKGIEVRSKNKMKKIHKVEKIGERKRGKGATKSLTVFLNSATSSIPKANVVSALFKASRWKQSHFAKEERREREDENGKERELGRNIMKKRGIRRKG